MKPRTRIAVFRDSEMLANQGLDEKCCACQFRPRGGGRVRQEHCSLTKKTVRVGWSTGVSGSEDIVLCSIGSETNKPLNTLLSLFSGSYKSISKVSQEAPRQSYALLAKRKNQQTRRFIHNLVTYNAKIRQAVEKLIAQEELLRTNDERAYIKRMIDSDVWATAEALLKVIKNSALGAAEVRTWELLEAPEGRKLRVEKIRLHKIVHLVTRLFKDEFASKSVRCDHSSSQDDVSANFDALQAALTNLVGNAAKYAKPNSTIEIRYSNEGEYVVLSLSMDSLFISPQESETVWNEGVRGAEAVAAGGPGEGIGLFAVRRLMDLTDGKISSSFGSANESTKNDRRYARNAFFVSLPVHKEILNQTRNNQRQARR